MNWYVKSIDVNQVFHLKDFSIGIEEKSPNLIITGKNGSGKTVLLRAIVEFWRGIMKDEVIGCFIDDNWYAEGQGSNDIITKTRNYCNVTLDMPSFLEIYRQYHDGEFIFAFYGAMRDNQMQEPKSPTKPSFKKVPAIDQSSTDQFLNFLSDLKIQEALARNERQISDADHIKEWFVSFENILGELYEDPGLRLNFNYKDYTFKINTAGKSFKFTEMSDGFTAAIDIMADLILRMQHGDSVTRAYDKPGIVMIDEIETHLHLGLQKHILKILTRAFPNIQFIVTTHSPFVLSSLEKATAFDLEHREAITDLSEYSYESLAEGYFGVHTESSYLGSKLEQLKGLLLKDTLAANEKKQKQELINEFNSIPEIISPLCVGEFRQLMIKAASKKS